MLSLWGVFQHDIDYFTLVCAYVYTAAILSAYLCYYLFCLAVVLLVFGKVYRDGLDYVFEQLLHP